METVQVWGNPVQVWCAFALRESQRAPSARSTPKFKQSMFMGCSVPLCSGFLVFGLLFEQSSPKIRVLGSVATVSLPYQTAMCQCVVP